MQDIAIQTTSTIAAVGASGMSDMNWLFSASAQTAGAIVAIVGGFLISSLLGLESRFSGLKERRCGLKTGMDQVSDQLGVAQSVITKNEIMIFIRGSLPQIVRSGGNVEAEKLFNTVNRHSLTIKDIKDPVKDVCEEVREAFAVLNKNALGQVTLDKSFDEYRRMKNSGVPAAADEVTWKLVYRHMLFASRDAQDPASLKSFLWRKGEKEEIERRYESSRTRRSNLERELDVLDAQYAATTAEAEEMNLPSEFGIALMLLFVLSLAGIMLPLALLPFPSAGTGILIKWLVLVPFYLCIAAIFAWLRWSSIRLQKELARWRERLLVSRSGVFEPADITDEHGPGIVL